MTHISLVIVVVFVVDYRYCIMFVWPSELATIVLSIYIVGRINTVQSEESFHRRITSEKTCIRTLYRAINQLPYTVNALTTMKGNGKKTISTTRHF